MSAVDWKSVKSYEDIRCERSEDGIAKITICRPEVHNAFRPRTLFELIDAFTRMREDPQVGVVLFTGAGTEAFCSGGDQRVRGENALLALDSQCIQQNVAAVTEKLLVRHLYSRHSGGVSSWSPCGWCSQALT